MMLKVEITDVEETIKLLDRANSLIEELEGILLQIHPINKFGAVELKADSSISSGED